MSLQEKLNTWESLHGSPVDESVDVIRPRSCTHTQNSPLREMCGLLDHLHPKGRARNICSVIEADNECTNPRAVHLREKIYKDIASSVFSSGRNTCDEGEESKHKRGDHFECKLKPFEGAEMTAVNQF